MSSMRGTGRGGDAVVVVSGDGEPPMTGRERLGARGRYALAARAAARAGNRGAFCYDARDGAERCGNGALLPLLRTRRRHPCGGSDVQGDGFGRSAAAAASSARTTAPARGWRPGRNG